MEKPKFKTGDIIVPKPDCTGIEEATVKWVKDGKYCLKIPRGIAVLSIGAQVNYQLKH